MWDWWFETPLRSLWHHCDGLANVCSRKGSQDWGLLPQMALFTSVCVLLFITLNISYVTLYVYPVNLSLILRFHTHNSHSKPHMWSGNVQWHSRIFLWVLILQPNELFPYFKQTTRHDWTTTWHIRFWNLHTVQQTVKPTGWVPTHFECLLLVPISPFVKSCNKKLFFFVNQNQLCQGQHFSMLWHIKSSVTCHFCLSYWAP